MFPAFSFIPIDFIGEDGGVFSLTGEDDGELLDLLSLLLFSFFLGESREFSGLLFIDVTGVFSLFFSLLLFGWLVKGSWLI